MEECVFDRGDECIALNEKQCENCSFRKTKVELIKGRQKFFARLPLIPKAQRIGILETYYGADKKW